MFYVKANCACVAFVIFRNSIEPVQSELSRGSRFHKAKRVDTFGSITGIFFIAGALVIGVIDNLPLFTSMGASIWIASASLSIIGFTCGTLIAHLVGIEWITCLVVGVEVGVQDTTLSISLILVTFAAASATVRSEAILFPLLCSFWDVVNSVILLILFKLKECRAPQAIADQETEKEDGGIALSSTAGS